MLICEEAFYPAEYSGYSHTSDTVFDSGFDQSVSASFTITEAGQESEGETYYVSLGTSLTSFFRTGNFDHGTTTVVGTSTDTQQFHSNGEFDMFSSAMMTGTTLFSTASASANHSNSNATSITTESADRNGTTEISYATDDSGFSVTSSSIEIWHAYSYFETINSTTDSVSAGSSSTSTSSSESASFLFSAGTFGAVGQVFKHSVYPIDTTSWLTGNITTYVNTVIEVITGTHYGTSSSTTTNLTGTATTTVSTEDIGGGTTITFPGTFPTTTMTTSLFDSSSIVFDYVTTDTSVPTDTPPWTTATTTLVPPGVSYDVKVTTWVNWTDDQFAAYRTVYVQEYDLSNDDWFWSFYPEDDLPGFLNFIFDWTDLFDSTSDNITIEPSVFSTEYPVINSTDFLGGSDGLSQTYVVRVFDSDADPNPITITITRTTNNGTVSYDTDASSYVTEGGTTILSYAVGSLTTLVGTDSISVIETQGSLPMLSYTTWTSFQDTTTVTSETTVYIISTETSSFDARRTKTIPIDEAIGTSTVYFVTGRFGSEGGYSTEISSYESITSQSGVGIDKDTQTTTSYDDTLGPATGNVFYNAGYTESDVLGGVFYLDNTTSFLSAFIPSFQPGFQLQPSIAYSDALYSGLGADVSMPYFDYYYQLVFIGGNPGNFQNTGQSCPIQWVEGGTNSTSDGTMGAIFGPLPIVGSPPGFGGFFTFETPFTYTGVYSLLDYGWIQTGSNAFELTTIDSTSWYFSWELTRTETDSSLLSIRPVVSVTSKHGTDTGSFTNSIYGVGSQLSSIVTYATNVGLMDFEGAQDNHIGGLPRAGASTNPQSVYISGIFRTFNTNDFEWQKHTFEDPDTTFLMSTNDITVIRTVKRREVIHSVGTLSGNDGFFLETFHKHTVPV